VSSKESEYRALFLMEAKENLEQLDKLFIDLEKNHSNQGAIKEIFRIMHTIKGNAMGLGIDPVADLSHVIEDVMLAIQEGKIKLEEKLFQLLFRGNDKLGDLVNAIDSGEKVSFLGIKTSLSLFLKKALEDDSADEAEDQEADEEVAEEPAPEPEEKESAPSNQISFSDVIQIPVKKMDDLMNEVGQLIIERDRIMALSLQNPVSGAELEALKRITSNLQYSIMNARMVQVGFLFNKFHRVLRDAAAIEGKKVNLVLKGTDVEIDRNILKVISDALVHLVRNAVSHGIESTADRKKSNKPEEGEVTLDATFERDRVIISVTDDGGGISADVIRKRIVEKGLVSEAIAKSLKEEEVILYIFEAGFSNAEKVNELSGRGVGMDVVKKAVESIGGQVDMQTKVGKGTTVSLHVPVSLALKGTMLFEVGDQQYVIALSYTEAVIEIKKHQIYKLGAGLTTDYQGDVISLVFMKDILELPELSGISKRGILQKSFEELEDDAVCEVMVVSYGGRSMGIVVDKVIQQKEIIEKPLTKPYDGNKLLSGTTILGSGRVCPVIDIAVLSDLIHKQAMQWQYEETK